MSPEVVILLVGSAVAAACALVGTFLVLRGMSMLGDAISHAVLPGIAVAFVLTGSRAALPMVIGAAALGVLTVFLVELLDRTRRLKEDASIGVVFPALFALGVIMISRWAGQVDLDLDCVLYGEIAYAPWDVLLIGGRSWGPEALWTSGAVLLLNTVLVTVFYKELKLSTFDAGLATALGFSPVLLHYVLMTAVSITVVGSFESVGAILVVAMLIVPPSAAYLLVDRLSRMLLLAVALGVLSAVVGYGAARWIDCSIAGAMAVVAGLELLAALLFSPRHGVLARARVHRRLQAELRERLVLLHLSDGGSAVPLATLALRFGWDEGLLERVVGRLARGGWVERTNGGVRLTGDGAERIDRTGHAQLAHPAT